MLRSQVRDLQRDLGLRAENGALGAMMDALGVTPTEALLLTVLRAAGGGYVASDALVEAAAIPDDQNLRSHVFRLRKKLGRQGVVSAWGRGYALTREALDRVESAMVVEA